MRACICLNASLCQYHLITFPKARISQDASAGRTKRGGEPIKQHLGWQWLEEETYLAKLMNLVTSSIVKVNFKSNPSACYLLNMEFVKRAIESQ